MTQHVMQAREGILTGYLENCCTCTSTIFEMSEKFTEDWWREKAHLQMVGFMKCNQSNKVSKAVENLN